MKKPKSLYPDFTEALLSLWIGEAAGGFQHHGQSTWWKQQKQQTNAGWCFMNCFILEENLKYSMKAFY